MRHAEFELLEARWLLSVGGFASAFKIDGAHEVAQAADPSGNVYVTGDFQGSVDFDPARRATRVLDEICPVRDTFLAKYSSTGQLAWVRRFGVAGSEAPAVGSLAFDAATGKLLVAGNFDDALDFGMTAPDQRARPALTLTSTGDLDGFFLRLNVKNGATEFAGQISGGSHGGASQSDLVEAAASDAAGEIYLSGTFLRSGSDNGVAFTVADGFLAKFSARGRFLWQHRFANDPGLSRFGALSQDVSALAVTPAGDAYLAGTSAGTTIFNAGSSARPLALETQGAFLFKVASNGEAQWVGGLDTGDRGLDAQHQGPPNPTIDALAVNAAGDVTVVGEFFGTTDFLFSPRRAYDIEPGGDSDGFIARYSPRGDFVWMRQVGDDFNDAGESQFGGEAASSVELDSVGNVFVGGYYTGLAYFNRGLTKAHLSESGNGAAFLAEYSDTGAFANAWNFGAAETMYLDNGPSGAIYLGGSLDAKSDLNPGRGVFDLAPNSLQAFYVLRLV
jgi:hypothetical protein